MAANTKSTSVKSGSCTNTANLTFRMEYSEQIECWKCAACDCEFAILNVLRGEDDYGNKVDTHSIWGNPDRPPICPHCGAKEGVSR